MKVDFDFGKDIRIVRATLQMSQVDFADALDVTNVTLSLWENGKAIPSKSQVEALYRFAEENGLPINTMKARFFEDDANGKKLLFHGSRRGIAFPIDLAHGNPKSDFGAAFYLGETLQQAGSWVNEMPEGSVYCFYFDPQKLNIMRFGVGRDWALAVCYYRGYLEGKEEHPLIQNLIKKIEEADVIVAPIADNLMYDTLRQFSSGYMTDEQCFHALSANHLGLQYILRSERSLNSVTPIARLYLAELERTKYAEIKRSEAMNGFAKLRISLSEYQNKGLYIDGILS